MFQQKNTNKPLFKYHRNHSASVNPYFQHRKKRTWGLGEFNWAGATDFLFYSLLIISFLIICYALFLSSFFQIKNVIVLNEIDDYAIKSLSQDFLRESNWGIKENNFFLLNKSELKSRILNSDSSLSDVIIRKVERHTITIELRFKEIAGYWQCENKLYAFENNGNLINDVKANNNFFETMELVENKFIGTINMSGLGEYPIIKTWQKQCPSQKIPLKSNILDEILLVFDYLKYYDLLKIVSFSFRDDISRNLEIKSLNGFAIYLDLNLDVLTQLKKFHVFYKYYLNNTTANSLEYIDLRIKEKIFYQ